VPESLIEAVHLDQCFNAGNRVVRHHADRPPEVLMAVQRQLFLPGSVN